MKQAFVLLRTAECDLDGIIEYLHAHAGRSKAVEFVEMIHAALELLGHSPQLGFQAAPPAVRYRIWPVKPYVVIYRAETRPIRIARIVHQSRDLRIVLSRLPPDDGREPLH